MGHGCAKKKKSAEKIVTTAWQVKGNEKVKEKEGERVTERNRGDNFSTNQKEK